MFIAALTNYNKKNMETNLPADECINKLSRYIQWNIIHTLKGKKCGCTLQLEGTPKLLY